MKLNICLFGGRGASSSSTPISEIKVKGDRNIIPRDFKKGYGTFKVETNSNEGVLNQRFEVTRDEFGEYHVKNLKTKESYAISRNVLSNNNIFEFEQKQTKLVKKKK